MTSTPDVSQFFATYAAALSDIDLDALADCYAYPSLAVSRLGRLAITEPDQTREFFAANGRGYHERGIRRVRITHLRAAYDEDGLWIGLADLENLAADGGLVDTELNAYQLVVEDGRWRIAVTSPLDAGRPAR